MENLDGKLEQQLKAYKDKFDNTYSAKDDSKSLTFRKSTHRKDIRDEFQRDRDRIIHSRAFRRLNGKTQVFNATKGDHYRTRLTHSLEVSQISRSIGKSLKLNIELIEAIALGHDLGHTPFGHVIERTLNDILRNDELAEIKTKVIGGFKHNFQSVHLVDNIEMGNNEKRGLNLTLAVRDGILKHTENKIKSKHKSQKEEVIYEVLDLTNEDILIMDYKHAITLEGQVVALADEIAQSTHDLEDGVRAGAINIVEFKDKLLEKIIDLENKIKDDQYNNKIANDMLKKLRDDMARIDENTSMKIGVVIRILIDFFIKDAMFNTIANLDKDNKKSIHKLGFIEKELVDNSKYIKEMRDFISNYIFKHVVSSQEVAQLDSKARYLIKQIFKAYYEDPRQLPDYALFRYYESQGKALDRTVIEEATNELRSNPEFIRLICDHIAGMTDHFATQEYNNLYGTSYQI